MAEAGREDTGSIDTIVDLGLDDRAAVVVKTDHEGPSGEMEAVSIDDDIDPALILIYGATGVGKTRIAREVGMLGLGGAAHNLDVARGAVRGERSNPDSRSIVHESSYTAAAQRPSYATRPKSHQRLLTEEKYRDHCNELAGSLCGALKTIIREGDPATAEGVMLLPEVVQGLSVYRKYGSRIYEVALYIKSTTTHRERFEQRQAQTDERPSEGYLTRFQEIRWIQSLLRRQAENYRIPLVHNNESPQEAAMEILNLYNDMKQEREQQVVKR